jgi:hypothetical protein
VSTPTQARQTLVMGTGVGGGGGVEEGEGGSALTWTFGAPVEGTGVQKELSSEHAGARGRVGVGGKEEGARNVSRRRMNWQSGTRREETPPRIIYTRRRGEIAAIGERSDDQDFFADMGARGSGNPSCFNNKKYASAGSQMF